MQRDATREELAAAVRKPGRPDRAMVERARVGLAAVDRGADPALVLSFVIWPSPAITAALAAAASAP